jgi:hypothetical protein
MHQSFFATKIGLAVVVGSLTILPLQAEAASVAGKTFSFYGSAQLKNADVSIGSSSTLDFSQGGNPGIPIGLGQATVAEASDLGSYNQQFTLRDLTLIKTSANTWSLDSLLGNTTQLGGSGLAANTWLNVASTDFSYALTKFDLTRGVNGDFDAVISGVFNPEGLGTQSGAFSSQLSLSAKKASFSGDITAVPTPALLPGLIGLGIGMVRKRKDQLAGVTDET